MTPFALLAAAAAASAAPVAVDGEIASLRGHRHTAYNLGEPVRPHAHCRSAGAGELYEQGRPVAGWEVGRYNCDGRVVVTLEREDEPQFGKPRMRIVDVLTVPGASFRRIAGTGLTVVVGAELSALFACGAQRAVRRDPSHCA